MIVKFEFVSPPTPKLYFILFYNNKLSGRQVSLIVRCDFS